MNLTAIKRTALLINSFSPLQQCCKSNQVNEHAFVLLMTCLCTVLTSHKFIWFFFSVFSVVVITLLGDHFIPRQLILSCSTLENVSSVLLVLWYPRDNDLCYKLVKNYTCTLCIRLLTYRDDLCSKIVRVVINLIIV